MGFTSFQDIGVSTRDEYKSFSIPYTGNYSNSPSSFPGRYQEWFEGMGGSFSGTAGVAASLTESSTGALYHGGNVSSETKHVLNWHTYGHTGSNCPCILFLVDLLLYYPSCVVTGSPTTLDNTVTLPRYTDGSNVQLAVIVQTTLGAATPQLTLTYTNSAGAGSRTSTVTALTTSMAAQQHLGTSLFLPLQGTDTGVRSIQSYTIDSGGTTGTVCLVLFKIIATTEVKSQTLVDRSYICPPILPRIVDGACLSFMSIAGGFLQTTSDHVGVINLGWGT